VVQRGDAMEHRYGAVLWGDIMGKWYRLMLRGDMEQRSGVMLWGSAMHSALG